MMCHHLCVPEVTLTDASGEPRRSSHSRPQRRVGPRPPEPLTGAPQAFRRGSSRPDSDPLQRLRRGQPPPDAPRLTCPDDLYTFGHDFPRVEHEGQVRSGTTSPERPAKARPRRVIGRPRATRPGTGCKEASRFPACYTGWITSRDGPRTKKDGPYSTSAIS
jgi:hypothetical protein